MKNILMLGPDLTVRGGISSVEKILLEKMRAAEKLHIKFIPTHRDISKAGKLMFAVKNYFKFLTSLLIDKIDVLYIHMSGDASFYRKSFFALTGVLFHKRIVFHMHGSDFDGFYKKGWYLIKRYIEFVIRKAHEIIVLTEEWKGFYFSINECENIIVIHNSVVVNDNHYNPEGNLITMLGRLGKRKGVYDILDVAEEIVKEHPDIRFVLAGDGEVENAIQTAVEKGLYEHVIVPGWVDAVQIEKILSTTVIYTLPSYAEGLPMSVLEAMAYGIPVIATDVGGLHEVIKSDENGILIKPGDKAALKDNIQRLLGQKELRMKLSHNGYQTLKDNFNADVFAQRVTEVLLR